jgi:uncharacterized protein (DUF433 family)
MAKEYIEERNGGYYLAGTRISLDSIVQCFNEGLSPEAIVGEFETLTLAQVFGAIAFYLENQPAIDPYRLRQLKRFEAARRDAARFRRICVIASLRPAKNCIPGVRNR